MSVIRQSFVCQCFISVVWNVLSVSTLTRSLPFCLTVGVASLLIVSPHASAVPIGDQILNGDFGTDVTPSLASWTQVVSGSGVNARASSNVINTTTGNNGFNSFFGDAFAALGDNTGGGGNAGIAGMPDNGINSISQSFTLPIIVGTYDLIISFRTVFDGDGDPTASDSFTATLTKPDLTVVILSSQNSSGFPNCAPSTSCANNQLVNNPFSQTLLGLPSGLYTLKFELNESALPSPGATNTAAGIDKVSVTGNSNIIPEPSALLLMLSGLAGAVAYLKRRKCRVYTRFRRSSENGRVRRVRKGVGSLLVTSELLNAHCLWNYC
jgi:hypothetical protein